MLLMKLGKEGTMKKLWLTKIFIPVLIIFITFISLIIILRMVLNKDLELNGNNKTIANIEFASSHSGFVWGEYESTTKLNVIIENSGNAPARNVVCHAFALDNDENVVDIGEFTYPRRKKYIKEIEPGEQVKVVVRFTVSDYYRIEYRFDWE